MTDRPESEIPTQAKALGSDLIVLGSHARWGLALLLGSTTDGVMHGADCDVLAVKVDTEPAAADRLIRGQKLSELRAIKRPPELTTRRVSHHRNPHAVRSINSRSSAMSAV